MHKAFLICLILCLAISSASAKSSGENIMNAAASQSNLKTFVAALETSGLNSTLEGKGPFTIFAPTDAAFNKMPKSQLDALMANKTAIRNVLAYHVVPGKLMSIDLAGQTSMKTLQGESLTVKSGNGGLMIDGATLVKANIEGTNGVIHVIDTVLIPK